MGWGAIRGKRYPQPKFSVEHPNNLLPVCVVAVLTKMAVLSRVAICLSWLFVKGASLVKSGRFHKDVLFARGSSLAEGGFLVKKLLCYKIRRYPTKMAISQRMLFPLSWPIR